MQKTDLYTLDYAETVRLLGNRGAAQDQARELWAWLYRRAARGFAEMDTLPASLRERLETEYTLCVPGLLARVESPAGDARKDLLAFADGERIETVLLRYRHRNSVCISTQIGCPVGCRFCATGQMGYVRQLSSSEIVAQVLHTRRALHEQQEELTNVVLMGMGEPLLNYDATLTALQRLVDPRACAFPPRRVTLSTVGIAPRLVDLARDAPPVKLAVSLHAATDELRDNLVPINRTYPLPVLFAAIGEYIAITRRRVLFEWALISGVNDTPQQAEALAQWLKDIPAHVNLIFLNPTDEYPGDPSADHAAADFTAVLDRYNIPHTVRQRRGSGIASGCGQLRTRCESLP